MIRTFIEGVQWGVDPIIDPTNPNVKGAQINLLDPQSNHLFHIPFSGDPLRDLVAALAKHLTADQQRELAPLFNGGIALPGKDFNANEIVKNAKRPQQGPQG